MRYGWRARLLIRTVQGHSGHVARQVDNDFAHERIFDKLQVPVLVHHTNSMNLYDILGRTNALGILPWGASWPRVQGETQYDPLFNNIGFARRRSPRQIPQAGHRLCLTARR